MELDKLKTIIESIIFASDSSVSFNTLKEIFGDEVDVDDIRQAIDKLVAEYNESNRGFWLQEIAGGYQFRTKQDFALWIKKLSKVKPTRLSQPSLETLAIIAYKQPITRPEIEQIRGVDVGGVLKTLLERKLIRIMGKKDLPGRPLIYGTTNEFLEVFGLKDLESLPTLKDFKEFESVKDIVPLPKEEEEENKTVKEEEEE